MKHFAIPRLGITLCGLAIFAAVTLCGCAPAVPEPKSPGDDPVSSAMYALTGARTRVVWVQDTADNNDFLAQRTNLQLMGMDTHDGRGERVILSGPRNFAKPFFTVDGRHVIFSDRIANTCHMVDWEGRKIRDLGPGFALTTWQDPRTGQEWLYVAREKIDERRTLPSHKHICRRPLETGRRGGWRRWARLGRPPRCEPVWDQTPVSEDSFQISAGGRYASTVFPWPEAGVLDLRAKRWIRLGRGCWVAMSPDNQHLFWIFDGPHRNVQMFDADTRENWMVNINSAPGIDNHEVYHPRWANHPRIIAMTGPYKIGDGANRLRGGGADVEIHLGRFAEDYRTVEAWARVTYNNRANFFPDVWIEPTEPHAEIEEHEIPAGQPAIPAWPLPPGQLVYLWRNADAQNEIATDDGFRLCRPEPKQLARYGRRHEMLLAGGYFVDDGAGAAFPADMPSFTLECILHPHTHTDPAKALIIAHAGDHDINFALYEKDGMYMWQAPGAANLQTLAPAAQDAPVHIVIAQAPDRLTFHLNGEPAGAWASRARVPWHPGRLLFGGHPAKSMDWPGRLEHVAIYRGALDERTMTIHHRLLRESIQARTPATLFEVRARVLSASAIPTPEEIAPYRRALVANKYVVLDGIHKHRRFLGAHWVILDGQVLPNAERPPGTEHDMRVELFEDRPELAGERLTMDVDDITLDLYLDLNL